MSQSLPHITVAAVVERNGRFLLVEENSSGRIVLNQPAGHLEQGESLVAAAVREVKEETGRDFMPEGIIGVYRWHSPLNHVTYVRVAFWGRVSEPVPGRKLDADILRTIWLTREELEARLEQLRSAMVLRCIDDFLAGRRFPLDLLVELQ